MHWAGRIWHSLSVRLLLLALVVSWGLPVAVVAAPDGQDDVTTGANAGATPGATTDVDWLAAATAPVDVGGGWVATTALNGDVYGTAPSTLNVLANGGADLGSLTSLAASQAHVVMVPEGTVAQRTEDAAQATLVIAGGQAWDFDYEDEDDDDSYTVGETLLSGYGVRVRGTVAQNAGGGGAIDIQAGPGVIVFVEVHNDGTITGNVTNTGNAGSILDIFPENDAAAAVTTQVTGNYTGGTNVDTLLLEAVSDSGDGSPTGDTTALLTGSASLGTSTTADYIEIVTSAITGNATATVTGTLTIAGVGDLILDADAEAGMTATNTVQGAISLGDVDDTIEIFATTADATATALINLQANLDLGNGANTVTIDADGRPGSKIIFNTAADGTGTTTDLLGGTGDDVITITNIASGNLVVDIDLATAAGGEDEVRLIGAFVTGNVTFGNATSSKLAINGVSGITGTLATNGSTVIEMRGTSLTIDGDLDINADTTLTRTTGTGTVAFDTAAGGTGAIDIAGGATFTVADTAILGLLPGGFTGTGTLAIQDGSLNEANAAIADGLRLTIAGGAFVMLNGNQTLGALNGAGTLDAGGNTLTLGTGDSTFTGTLANLGDLVVTGGTQQITDVLQVNNLTVSGGTLMITGGVGIRAGAPRVITLDGATSIQGDLTLDADTTITGTSGLTLTASGTDAGEIDIDAGLTLTVADAMRLTNIAGGIVGEGTLLLQAGSLNEAAADIGDGLTLNIAGGATVTLTGNQVLEALLGSGTLDAGGANLSLGTGNSTFTGTLSNLGNLTLTGGTNALTTGVSVTALSVTGGANTITGNVALNNLSVTGGTLDIVGDLAVSMGAGTRTLTISGATSVAGDIAINQDTTLNGTAALTVTAGGASGAIDLGVGTTLTLANGARLASAAGGFTGMGTVSLQAGTLSEANAAIADGVGLAVASGATVTLAGDQSLSALGGAGTLNANGNNLTLTTGMSTFTGTLSNLKDLTFDGAGTHSLTVGNASFGETAANAAALTVANGATATLTGSGASVTGDVVVNGGSLTLAGTYSFGETGTDATALTVAAGATARLLGTPTITGSLAVSGTLETSTASLAAAALAVQPGATLKASGATGLTLNAATTTDLTAINADTHSLGLNATAGAVTVQNWTLPSIAGNGQITVGATNTASKVTLSNLALDNGATDENLRVSAGKVYLSGTLDTGNAGDVIDAAAGATIVLDTAVAGAGSVAKGAGTLLYGPNATGIAYNLDAQSGIDSGTSGATISDPVSVTAAAVFAGGGTVTLSNTVTIAPAANAATLSVNEAGTQVVISNLAGLTPADTLNKDGDGTLALAAPVPGNLAASAGAVALNSGSSVGGNLSSTGATVTLASGASVTGNVSVDGGAVRLAGDAIGGDLLVGAGGATVEPQGTVTLDDDVTLGGAMVVGGNKLAVGGTVTTGGNPVTTNAGATFEVTGAVTGALTKDGTGTLVLNGAGTDNDVTVNAGVLMGTGPIAGNLLLAAGGIHAPGNSIGTVNINGTYTLSTGSIVQIEIDADAGQTADLINVTGNAVLQNGSTIRIVQADGTIATNDTFTIIQTTTGISDLGAAVESTVATQFAGSVVGNNYILTATTRPFVDLAVGGNQLGIARALDAMTANDLTVALGALPESQFAAAVQQLDAAPHIAAAGTAIPTITAANGHITGHMAGLRSGDAAMGYMQSSPVGMSFAQAAQDPRMLRQTIDAASAPAARVEAQADGGESLLTWRPFAKVYGTFAEQDTTASQTGYDANTVGVIAGIDTALGEAVHAGLMVGYSYTDIEYDQSRGDADVHSLRVGPYATFDLGRLFIDASVTMGYHWNDATRKVTVGTFTGEADSEYNAWDLALYGGVGYDIDVYGVTVTPLASLQWVHYEQESFRESGAGAANLAVDSWETDSLRHVLALKASKVFDCGTMKIVPECYMGWGHEYLEDDKITSRFVGQATPFSFESDSDSRDSLLYGFGASFLLNENISVFVRYDGTCSSQQTVHNVAAGLRIDF